MHVTLVPEQLPPEQESPVVHRFPSSHADPPAITVALVVPMPPDAHPLIVTVYVPEAAGVAFGIEGFWRFEENPFGPVQL